MEERKSRGVGLNRPGRGPRDGWGTRRDPPGDENQLRALSRGTGVERVKMGTELVGENLFCEVEGGGGGAGGVAGGDRGGAIDVDTERALGVGDNLTVDPDEDFRALAQGDVGTAVGAGDDPDGDIRVADLGTTSAVAAHVLFHALLYVGDLPGGE